MKYLITTALLALLTILTFSGSPTLANRPKPRPWSYAFRSGWNQACFDVIHAGVQKDRLTAQFPDNKIRNLCDCTSDYLQDRFSEQEILTYDKDNVPPEFMKASIDATKMCLSDPV